jgi:hypothetical protein
LAKAAINAGETIMRLKVEVGLQQMGVSPHVTLNKRPVLVSVKPALNG